MAKASGCGLCFTSNSIHPELLLERQIIMNISENGLDGYRDGVEIYATVDAKYLEGTSVINDPTERILDLSLMQIPQSLHR